MPRRIPAFIAALLLLNVSSAEALRACADQPHQAAPAAGGPATEALATEALATEALATEALATEALAAEPAATEAADPHAHHRAPATVPDDVPAEDCETPAASRCCSALSSCGASLDLGTADPESDSAPDSGEAMRAADRAPSTRVFAPEPPPPKA